MRVLYFDAFSGVSGDMTVGALLSLGLDFARLQTELRKLPLEGYTLRLTDKFVNGIRARKFDVDIDTAGGHDSATGHGAHAHPAESDHSHHHHHSHTHAAGEEVHTHRAFREIRAMIEQSQLAAPVKQRALAIFTKLADAEGRVHGVATDDVTFHEVGAVDSIVDIVGTAIGLVELDVGHAYTSPLPMGSGLTRSQHGIIPVPTPATVEVLRGFPVRISDGSGELVTPTGAAIVATMAVPGETLPMLRIEAVGYGAGTKTLSDRPNVLRLLLGTPAATSATDDMVLVETNIDDANPELFDYVMEQLFAAGARDVWLTPAHMKKNRPGIVLHALAEPAQRSAIAAIMLRETSTIGVRYTPVQRTILPREQISVQTEFGTVLVKIARAPDGTINLAPEYDSCSEIARQRGVPLKLVYRAALAAAQQRGG